MASIRRRRREGQDVWIVDYRDAGGRRHRLTASSRAQAEDLLAEKIDLSDLFGRAASYIDKVLKG